MVTMRFSLKYKLSNVISLIDNTHAAPADFGEDLVVADRAADHDGQIVALPDTWW